jgi:hypothetical protein
MRKPEHDDLIGLIRPGIECGATQSRGSPLPEWQDFDAFVTLDSQYPDAHFKRRIYLAGDSAHQTIINVESNIAVGRPPHEAGRCTHEDKVKRSIGGPQPTNP